MNDEIMLVNKRTLLMNINELITNVNQNNLPHTKRRTSQSFNSVYDTLILQHLVNG